MGILDADLGKELAGYLEKLQKPVVFDFFPEASSRSEEMLSFLEEIVALSGRLSIRGGKDHARRPCFGLRGEENTASRIFFAGIPLGHEFTSFVLALLQVGGHPLKLEPETIETISSLKGEFHFDTYISLSCHNCPDVVQSLNLLALLNPGITHTTIDGAFFQEELQKKGIMAVPTVYLNNAFFKTGRMGLGEILDQLDSSAAQKTTGKISREKPFDVLVIGGGPAGSAAAVYSARKGLRTGLVAERFGGQLLDTQLIENFISVQQTEGPKLAASLEAHVRSHEISILTSQRIKTILPAETKGALHEISLESGANLRAKALIVASGARWHEMNVPGENAYRTKGVTFCPHCDGPLFKGKVVAVIGGGNSGVEAAIDLAGIAEKVFLLEREAVLKADDVLQKKLAGLPNVTTMTKIRVMEVLGDGERVRGLSYEDGSDGLQQTLSLDGVFVQIGLLPNSGFLGNVLETDAYGQIVVDAACRTSVAGIFAAGDVTDTPYKQIVIALGEGAKAALSAFDYLIRN